MEKRTLGSMLIAVAIILRQFAESNLTNFLQGFAIGLGLCLILASYFWNHKRIAHCK